MPQLVSVVIPAYNAAARIERTIAAIAAQDYSSVEIIVVDDASADGTGDLAGNALARSGRDFRVIRHEANMGEGAARHRGLRAVSGEYVIFFDADDLADPDFVSTLAGAITADDCDAAFCGLRDRFEDTGRERAAAVGLDQGHRYSAEELTVMYIFRLVRPSVCTAIFKTGFLEALGLEFTADCCRGADVEFLVKAFSRCERIGFSTECPYIYMHHSDMISETSKSTTEKHILRYSDNAGALCRAARYLAENAGSPKVRGIAADLMLAEGLIKRLNAEAMRNDEAKFFEILRAPETKRALRASLGYCLKKTEVSIKALLLSIAPRTYFRIRSRSVQP